MKDKLPQRIEQRPITVAELPLPPQGSPVDYLLAEKRLGTIDNIPPSLQRAYDRIGNLTDGNFSFATAIDVPESLNDGLQPTIYINETNFCVPPDDFKDIPELILWQDIDLIRYLIEKGNLAELAADANSTWVFPGNGGIYIQEMLENEGIYPKISLRIKARRNIGKDVTCDVSLPELDNSQLDTMQQTRRLVFVDDAICSGTTVAACISTLIEKYGTKPEVVTIVSQTFGNPRSKEDFLQFLEKMKAQGINMQLIASLFYGGQTRRPRLLTTGSIVDGIKDPERFSSKNYSPQLIEKIRQSCGI